MLRLIFLKFSLFMYFTELIKKNINLKAQNIFFRSKKQKNAPFFFYVGREFKFFMMRP